MDVKDIMTKDPITIDADAPVGTAVAVMVDRKVRHLPVVDEQGMLIGIVTDRDLRSLTLGRAAEPYLSAGARRRLRGIDATLENLRIKEVMTGQPVTAKPDMALSQAAALMLEQHVGSLPVIEDGRLVGIITDRDAVKALALQVPSLKYAVESLW